MNEVFQKSYQAYNADPMLRWAVNRYMKWLGPLTRNEKRRIIASLYQELPHDMQYTNIRSYPERVERLKRVCTIFNGIANEKVLVPSRIGVVL